MGMGGNCVDDLDDVVFGWPLFSKMRNGEMFRDGGRI